MLKRGTYYLCLLESGKIRCVSSRRSGSYCMQECPLRSSVGIDRIANMLQMAAELSKCTLLPSRGILELLR